MSTTPKPTDDLWRLFPQMPFLTAIVPYISDKDDEAGIEYQCYTSNSPRVIVRITKVGNITTTEKAFGWWEDRASLTYVPINDKNPDAQDKLPEV